MRATATTESERPLSEKQRAALVSLLTDEDPVVYRTVRQKILSLGQESIGWLQPHTLSNDPVLRRRSAEIIHHLARQAADNKFLGFCLSQGEDLDLENGVWALAKTQYPEMNPQAYSALLDSYASDLRDRMDLSSTADHLLGTVNRYLFQELSFVGNEQNYYDPDNSYLNQVMDRRTGNPISLCVVYILLSRRLHLPVAGIGMPGHFLARFQSSTTEVYIDAFNKGKLLTKADCIKYLVNTNHGFQEGFLAPVSSRRILLRICSNLFQIYQQLEATEDASRLQRYIIALAK